MSRATSICNILYGNKKLSIFEPAKGYTPSLGGLLQSRVRQELIAAHEEQTARRALQILETTSNPRTIDPPLLLRDTPVNYFKKGMKFGKWEKGYVRYLQPHSVSISSKPRHNGLPIRAAFGDVPVVEVFSPAGT